MLSEIKARAAAVQGRAQELEALLAELRSGDRQEAYHAAWVMTHLRGEALKGIEAHRAELIGLALGVMRTSE